MAEVIGFVGLGIMGSGMVRNLVAKGHIVRVFSREGAKARTFAREVPVEVADSIEELAQRCGAIILCVSDTPDVEAVVRGPGGLLPHLAPGSLVIDCSTISPAASQILARELAAHGVGFVDAPVSGGSEGAARGTLAIMAGGTDADFARALPLLEAIGNRITHMGGPGSGQATKLFNQILVVINMLAVSEALIFGRAVGLDLDKAISAVEHGAAGSWMLSNRGTQVLADYWDPGFTIDLQQKDLRLVLQSANEHGAPLVATGLIYQLYATLQHAGKGALGNHALIQSLEALAGFSVSGRKIAS